LGYFTYLVLILVSFFREETTSGMYFWVIMMREFFIGVNNFRDISRSRINEEKQ